MARLSIFPPISSEKENHHAMCESKPMLRRAKRVARLMIASFVAFAAFYIPRLAGAVSITGSAATLARGYQDLEGEDHYDLAQGLRFRAGDFGLGGLSLHAYVQYYGDEQDDFSQSGTFRLYHGYLKYAKFGSPLDLRVGRFFLFRGVAVGILDGGEASYRVSPRWALTAFGGFQGPLSREWEINPHGTSPMLGGELRWHSGSILGVNPTFALSYTRQERDGDLLRHLMGLSFAFKINRQWSSLNVVHVNLEGSPLRKALTRWRYASQKFQFSIEAALIRPYVAAYSYFSDFEAEGTTIRRLRNTLEYHIVPRKWGAGLSTMYFATSEYGFRSGPYVIFPYGRIGYHFTAGDQPTNKVLWGYFRMSPLAYLDLFAYAASMEYEWEAMDVESQETTAVNSGFKLRPPFLKRTEFGLEWQNYRTPQLEADRRLIFTFQWNFDYQVKE